MNREQIHYAVCGEASNYSDRDWNELRFKNICYEAFKAGSYFMYDLMESEFKESLNAKDNYIQELESKIRKSKNVQ